MSWRTPYEGEVKTLKLTADPMRNGLGHYDDIDGNKWDVISIIGGNHSESSKPHINARPVTACPYYSTATNGHQNGHHRWKPYYFEVICE